MLERATEAAIDATFDAYVICALWCSHGDDDEALEVHYTADDLSPETAQQMRDDVTAFLFTCWDDLNLDLSPLEPGQIGHDFWLTRNHHGAGFWDRGLGDLGDALTTLAHGYGDCDLYVGDDGLLHV